jgi:uncharacterized membrane protein
MKKIFFLLLILLSFGIPHAYSKNFKILKVNIEAEIKPDGIVTIKEKRTYLFEGKFTWANYKLPKNGFDSLMNIRMQVNGQPLINSNIKESGTFQVKESSSAVEIKWYFEAEDKVMDFMIIYDLQGALVSGSEHTEFYWTYLSNKWKKETESLEVRLKLPESTENDSLFTWLKTGASNVELNKEKNGIHIVGSNINSSDQVALRLVFPTGILNREDLNITGYRLEQAKQEELAIAEKENRRKKQKEAFAQFSLPIAILIILISISTYYLIYLKYGKNHQAQDRIPQRFTSLPSDEHPALIGWLYYSRGIGASLLTATVFELARKGYFNIVELDVQKKWYERSLPHFSLEKSEKEPGADLEDFELMLYTYLVKRIEDGKNRFDQLFKNTGFKTEASSFYTKWQAQLKSAGKSRDWFDQNSITWSIKSALIQVFLLLSNVFILLGDPQMAIVPGFTTIMLLICSAAIIRRTPEGEFLYRKILAYRKTMKALGVKVMESSPERHYINAIAMGLNQKDIEKIFDQKDVAASFPWIVLLTGNNASVYNITHRLSTLAASGTTSFGGVAGGGATAGSAGGGAGGGAG